MNFPLTAFSVIFISENKQKLEFDDSLFFALMVFANAQKEEEKCQYSQSETQKRVEQLPGSCVRLDS